MILTTFLFLSDIVRILEPFADRGPAVILSALIVIGFMTGWLIPKAMYQREVKAHKETKELLAEAIDGWKAQTAETEKANRLVQRVVDVLRLREVLAKERPDE